MMNTNKGFKLPKLIGLIHSEVKREYFPTEEQYLTEKDAVRDAEIVAKYIEKLGIKAKLYPGNSKLTTSLERDRPDLVFNLVGSVYGNEYLASAIPGILEVLGIPYTGSGILGESLCYNKFLVKMLMRQVGIPVPNCQILNSQNDNLAPELKFPVISKLNEIHGGVEINENAISEDENHLRKRVKYLIETYKQPVIVEEFIGGREMTAILLEGLKKKVYIAEKVFNKPKEKYVFMTFEDNWGEEAGGQPSFEYQKYTNKTLKAYVKRAFKILKMADYAKFDIRMDEAGRFYFVDANSNPAFGPRELGCAIGIILDMYGITFEEILLRIITNTLNI